MTPPGYGRKLQTWAVVLQPSEHCWAVQYEQQAPPMQDCPLGQLADVAHWQEPMEQVCPLVQLADVVHDGLEHWGVVVHPGPGHSAGVVQPRAGPPRMTSEATALIDG